MNYFKNFFSGKKDKSPESKSKEEEDMELEKIVKLNISKDCSEMLEMVLTNLDSKFQCLMETYQPNYREIDYRYNVLTKSESKITNLSINSNKNTNLSLNEDEKNNSNNSNDNDISNYNNINANYNVNTCNDYTDYEIIEVDDITKMKTIGKAYIEEESLFNDFSDKVDYKYNECRIEAISNFPTVKCKNFVFKGKWFYEIRILTNKCNQIGWARINTVSNKTSGVGDDETSYAIDGYRVLAWNGTHKKYGTFWDIGDVIGCCIDLDNARLEYFINGVSQGIAYDNIKVGANIGYFPAITISKKEKCIVNTGQFKFMYNNNYVLANKEKYEPFDIPIATINNLAYSTENIIKLIKTSYLEENNYLSVIYSGVDFISNVSCKDIYCIKEIVIPYLAELVESKESYFINFTQILLNTSNNKTELIKKILDNVIYRIEELFIIGEHKVKLAKLHLKLFILLLSSFESVLIVWREECSYTYDIKSIFNCNNTKLKEHLNYFRNNNMSVASCLEYTQENVLHNYNEDNEYYNTVNSAFIDFILLLLTDTRKIETQKMKDTANENTNTSYPLLKQLIVETLNSAYTYRGILHELGGDLFLSVNNNTCSILDLENIASTFLFPFMNYMINNKILTFENINVEPWIKRTEPKTWFYNEIGIGGTINHVTKEYGEVVFNNVNLKRKECSFYDEFQHRIMKLTYFLIGELYKNYMDVSNKIGNATFSLLNIQDHGSDALYNYIRPLHQVFNLKHQQLLYSYSYFLLDMFSKFKKEQKEILYFIPKFVMDIPLMCFNLLVLLKSPVLFKTKILEEKSGKQISPNTQDYFYQVLIFYTDVLNDKNINNPEIIESLLFSIYRFVSLDYTFDCYINNKELLSTLISGVIRFLNNEALFNITSAILFAIIKPACETTSYKNEIKESITKTISDCFYEQKEFYYLFLDAYSTLVNKNLTQYTAYLEELIKIKANSKTTESELKSCFKIFENSCVKFNDSLLLYQAIIITSPEVLNIRSLTFSRLNMLLCSISSRVIGKPYLQYATDFAKTYDSNCILSILITLEVISYVLYGRIKCNNSSSLNNNLTIKKEINFKEDEYIENLAKQDVEYNFFLDAITVIDNSKEHKDIFSYYKSTCVEFFKLILEKKEIVNKKMEGIDEDLICPICCNNEVDTKMLPCGHTVCWNCLSVYLRQSKQCFFCFKEVEDTDSLSKSKEGSEIKKDLNK